MTWLDDAHVIQLDQVTWLDDAHVIASEAHEHLQRIILRLILEQAATVHKELLVSQLDLKAELDVS